MPRGTQRLKRLVRASGLTQEAFAKTHLRHVSYRALKYYLGGKAMPPRVLEQVEALPLPRSTK